MPYKDPARQAQYMRDLRARQKMDRVNKVNVNLSVNPRPVKQKIQSMVLGEFNSGYWEGICPACSKHNKMDPQRSYRPFESCKHFQQLETPGKPSPFLFLRELTKIRQVNKVNVNQDVNPVRKSYILSYSRKKYQFVLYSVDSEGKKSLVRSYAKGEKVVLGNALIELTWGPDLDIVKEDFQ